MRNLWDSKYRWLWIAIVSAVLLSVGLCRGLPLCIFGWNEILSHDFFRTHHGVLSGAPGRNVVKVSIPKLKFVKFTDYADQTSAEEVYGGSIVDLDDGTRAFVPRLRIIGSYEGAEVRLEEF